MSIVRRRLLTKPEVRRANPERARICRLQQRADELCDRGERFAARLVLRVVAALREPQRLDRAGDTRAQCIDLRFAEKLVVLPLDREYRAANAGNVGFQTPA